MRKAAQRGLKGLLKKATREGGELKAFSGPPFVGGCLWGGVCHEKIRSRGLALLRARE